jgi:hypothetical protein
MQSSPPNPPDKEGPLLPWLETQGHPGPTSVMMLRLEKERDAWVIACEGVPFFFALRLPRAH